MSIPRIVTALNHIDDDLVAGAVEYKPKKKRLWKAWVALAACLCLVGALCGSHWHMKQYVLKNHITVYSEGEYSLFTHVEIVPEYADEVETAYGIHGVLSQQNYAWYGNCRFDFDSEKIMVGLTEVTDSNIEAVLAHTGDTPVAFYQCEYSYQYLQQLYDTLESRRAALSWLGVKGFGIYEEQNRVAVYLGSAENYVAIYAVSKLDSKGGAITFITQENVCRID